MFNFGWDGGDLGRRGEGGRSPLIKALRARISLKGEYLSWERGRGQFSLRDLSCK
jgi:hypothetical protein